MTWAEAMEHARRRSAVNGYRYYVYGYQPRGPRSKVWRYTALPTNRPVRKPS